MCIAARPSLHAVFLPIHTRPDTKNYLYQQSIKQGDLLLNRIQKLSKVIDVE